MSRTSSRLLVAFALVLAFLCNGVNAVYAGTTGALTGKVMNTATQAPIAGAKVTVASPSGSASTVSDKNGSFAFLSLAPDTYALNVSYGGFDTATTSGITIQADQTATYNVTLAKSLQTIGRVQSRSNATLIQPGVSTDVYNIGVAQQRAAATLGGGGGLNNAYSAIASVPGVFVPQGQNGTYQSIFVRGSNYTQVGYEYDGVPIQRSFDQYPGGNLSSLGQQEVQVYVGSAPTGTGSTALAGFINQVIRTGTYPGFANVALGFGGPSKYGNIRLEGGGSSPDRNFNYYVGTAGYHQDLLFQRVTEYDKIYGSQLDVYKTNCGTNGSAGCYANTALAGGPLGPNGYQLGPLFWGASTYQTDRDTVANFHWGIPHKKSNDGGRDDIQLLYNTTLVQTYFATAPTDWGPFLNAINTGTYGGAPTCATAASTNCNLFGATPGVYLDKQIFNGPTGTFLTAGDIGNTAPSYFPGSPTNRAPSIAGNRVAQDPFERDNYQQSGAIVKLQYQRNINSRSYARIYGYSEYSDWLQYGQGGFWPSFVGSISSDYKLGSHTRGLAFTYANQLNDKHLLNFNAAYTTSSTFRNNNSAVSPSAATTSAGSTTVAFLVDSNNPTNGICYTVTGVGINCSSANSARYVLPVAGGGALLPSNPAVTIANAGALTCGTGPCAFFNVANGNAASYNTVTPKFTSLSLSDKFQVNDKLSLDLGLRYDDFKYQLVDTNTGLARQFWVNYFNKWNCFDNGTQVLVTRPTVAGAPGPCPASAVGGANTVPATFTAVSDPQEDYPELQPRFGATYTVNRNNVIRLSAGKYAQPASSAFQQYNTTNPNFLALNQTFYPIGFKQPSHRILPEESINFDASWEHQFNGTDASFKFTPYVRNTKNELTTVLLDAKTNFVSGINVGRKSVKGLEFQINKGDLAKDGFYGSLGYTYTFARVRFDRFSNGTDINTSLNNAVALYNSYTSFCATNATDARCRVFGVPNSTQANPGFAVPCFIPATSTTPAIPTNACPAGSVANPYYNLPVQNLYDPNGVYQVYNTYSGSLRGTGSNQSYIPPHVMTFIGNYKHGKLNITPTAQFQGGSQYGRPLQVSGINPATCKPLAGAGNTTVGDPRYPGTQPGTPYDASTCGLAIVIPDPFVGHFDNYGQFTEPNRLAINLSLSYDVSKQVSLKVDMVNVSTSCWGGSNVPWKIGGRAGCDYGGGTFASNFYNPGDVIQAGYNQPYAPTFGNVFQSTAGGQANPFQVYATLNVKM